jgi:hypothetical protein
MESLNLSSECAGRARAVVKLGSEMPMNVYGFHCKTPGCKAFLVAGELAEDTERSIQVPYNLGDDPRKLQCPDCKEAHDYYFSEKVIAKATP